MSEDNIDSFLVDLIKCLEVMGCQINFDDDVLYTGFREWVLDWFEPFYTRERNYN